MILYLFRIFLQIGLFSIGGGYAVIPLIQEQVVETHQWIDRKIFTDIITISQMTPGPLAVNTSTFVGIRTAGMAGAAAATAGCVLPGILLSCLLYRFFRRHRDASWTMEILNGLKAASLGLIVSAGAAILLLTLFGVSGWRELSGGSLNLPAAVLLTACIVILRRLKPNPVFLMLLTGAAGLLMYYLFR